MPVYQRWAMNLSARRLPVGRLNSVLIAEGFLIGATRPILTADLGG